MVGLNVLFKVESTSFPIVERILELVFGLRLDVISIRGAKVVVIEGLVGTSTILGATKWLDPCPGIVLAADASKKFPNFAVVCSKGWISHTLGSHVG